ncbi:MAG: hypothetical protein IH840_17995, partial [Candidatus Heimdallarchaeota archaeon]|nr:hypothetical protein [Candidatus Heimdallarchaeota archaeon]
MIKTLIIMTTYGQIFYSKQTFLGAEAGDEDISLTAGLISAIYSMTSETQQQKITELELEDLRLVFRELPGEKLFIITVDKRMDIADADDLLGVMVEAFNKKYGDDIMDGLILNDFEPVADEIVADKLWYATTEKSIKPVDIGASILLFLTFLFYPTWLLSGDDWIINPIKESLNDGLFQLIVTSIVIGLMTAVPITLLIYILSRISKISQTFRFASEFLRRPTRGGYAEVLPSWFLIFPIAMCLLFGAVIYSGRGLQYGLTAQTFSPGLDNALTNEGNPEIFGIKIFWLYVFSYLVFYLATWFIFMPVLLGFITQNFNWTFIKSSWIIIGISMVGFIPAQIIAGISKSPDLVDKGVQGSAGCCD